MLKKILALGSVFLLGLVVTLLFLARGGGGADTGSRLSRLGTVTTGGPVDASSQIRLREGDLGRLLVDKLGESERGERLLAVAKDVRAQLREGRVELGMVVNLADVRRTELSQDEREAVEKIARYLPFLEDKDLYLAVSGRPAVHDGRVTVEDDLQVRLAFLSLPVGEFADALGFDPRQLRESLKLDLSPFVATAAVVADGELVISVGAGP